jgi:hypothetical protein
MLGAGEKETYSVRHVSVWAPQLTEYDDKSSRAKYVKHVTNMDELKY